MGNDYCVIRMEGNLDIELYRACHLNYIKLRINTDRKCLKTSLELIFGWGVARRRNLDSDRPGSEPPLSPVCACYLETDYLGSVAPLSPNH